MVSVAPTASSFTDYTVGGTQAGNEGSVTKAKDGFWSHERLKRSYMDYLGSKVNEFEEQKDARRYRHGTQWTSQQVKVLNKRKQPIVTYNHIGPKINGVIGLIEKLRQAPRAFPRTPKEQEGADLATAVIRYVLDEQAWKEKSPICAEDGAVDGIGGIEIVIEPGDQGDPEIGFNVVEPSDFFYDPRSYQLDFSDVRYMGQAKWFDIDHAIEMFPQFEQEIRESVESGTELTTNADRELKWFISDGDIKRVRIVDEWYKSNGEWRWCIYTGAAILQQGISPLIDEKNRTACKYIMFSASIDQDGDRYGFVRQFKSAQDEINQRRSKALHTLSMRRIRAEKGAFDNVEQVRVEATRPDGVVIYNKGFQADFDDAARMQETEAQLKFLQEAKAELDSYGPTLSLIGDQPQDLSGRAIQLQQQAGIAQLGPFILSYKGWKIRVYRAVWNAIRKYWKAERWIRVTDDPQSLEFVGINQVGVHPQTGMPTMMNQVSALDVDIILDEGPDSINVMADTYSALMALAQSGSQVPPSVLIELAPGLDQNTRQKLLQQLSQPDPLAQQKAMLEMQNAQATIAKTAGQAKLANAQAVQALSQVTQGPDVHFEQPENPAVVQADIGLTNAKADEHRAKTLKALHDVAIKPAEMQHETGLEAMRQAPKVAQMAQQQEQTASPAANTAAPQQGTSAPAAAPQPISINLGVEKSMDGIGQVMAHHAVHTAKLAEATQAIMQAHHENSRHLAAAAGSMAESAKHIAGAVSEMNKNSKAPRKIVRDKTGRASHVEIG